VARVEPDGTVSDDQMALTIERAHLPSRQPEIFVVMNALQAYEKENEAGSDCGVMLPRFTGAFVATLG